MEGVAKAMDDKGRARKWQSPSGEGGEMGRQGWGRRDGSTRGTEPGNIQLQGCGQGAVFYNPGCIAGVGGLE